MYVLDQGTGPAILLVPGLGCDHTMYRPQIESLEGVRCLAVDLRGNGRSLSLTDVSDRDVLALQVDDIADALADRPYPASASGRHLLWRSCGARVHAQTP